MKKTAFLRFILPLFVVLLVPLFAQAQMVQQVSKTIFVERPDSTYLLDPWIIQNSLRVTVGDNELEEQRYSISWHSGFWKYLHDFEEDFVPFQAHFTYKIIPFSVSPVFFSREIISVPSGEGQAPTQAIVRSRAQEDIFGQTNLQRSGSLSRGITVGTDRDFSLESGLRFELSGFITDEIEVLATLTDQSTPIQPDGSTQNLREFDQVFIRLRTPNHQIQMGDVDVRLSNSEFAVIDRRLQGAEVRTDFANYGQYDASASVVRGVFNSMRFNGQDGIQGPYRLEGRNNEQFIIVLAGTERVYLNGQRMIRGEENDYIIDYGLGEIRFTNKRLITENSRITVDFQYITERFTRTLLTAEATNTELRNGRWVIGASYIREADNIDVSTQFQLTEEEIEILRSVGNNLENAVISGVDSVGYREDADFILYSRVDTLFQGQMYTIYKNIPGDESGVFRVRFTRIGEGQGSYRRVGRAVNGILYEWVGPGNGSYEPFRRISAPQEQSMVALRSQYSVRKGVTFFAEGAVSTFDQNRFSALDNDGNNDIGYLFGIQAQQLDTPLGLFSGTVRHRFTGHNFAFFDRTQDVEFDRRWNISELSQEQEQITEGDIKLEFTPKTFVQYGGGYIARASFTGLRQELLLNSREEGLPFLQNRIEYIRSEDAPRDIEGNWFRTSGSLGYDISVGTTTVTPRVGLEAEQRLQRVMAEDTLTLGTLRFYDVRPGADIVFSEHVTAFAEVSYRKDQALIGQELEDRSVGITQQYGVRYQPSSTFQTENTFGLRSRNFEEYFRIERQEQNSRGVLIRSASVARPMNRFIDAQLLYEANTERRPLLQETYIEVGPELGQFVWIDLNGDGVQQIDEFFPQQSPSEGTFLRQFIPSDELFPVISLRTRLRLRLDPIRIMDRPRDGSFMRRFIAGTQSNTIIEIREDNQTQNLEDIYLLRLHTFRDDSLTIQGRLYWQQEITMFRQNPDYDLRIVVDRTLGQNRQANGLEKQEIFNLRVHPGFRWQRRYVFSSEFRYGRQNNSSATLSSRNFNITSYEARPRLDVQFDRSFQAATGLGFVLREDNQQLNPAKMNGFSTFAESRLFFARGLQSNLRIERRANTITGETSSLGSFELTDGAGEGVTWSWNAQVNYRISDFLRAGVTYDGRTISDRPTVQTLRIVFNAVF